MGGYIARRLGSTLVVMAIVGAIVFLFDSRVRFAHFVWHLFVLGGSACHFVAVLRYAQ